MNVENQTGSVCIQQLLIWRYMTTEPRNETWQKMFDHARELVCPEVSYRLVSEGKRQEEAERRNETAFLVRYASFAYFLHSFDVPK